jgi:outer membrane protein, heavy metal efflux system
VVLLALACSPAIRTTRSRLGVGAAEVFEATRLANPSFGWSRMRGHEGTQYTRSAGLNLAELLVLPQRSKLASRDFEALKIEIAAATVELAREVESSWYRHVAAQQALQLAEAVAEAADTSAELAARFHSAGNLSRLELLHERAAAGEARIEAAHARAEAIEARAELNALIGLSGADAARWQATPQLPLPAGAEPELEALLADAREQPLDLRAARLQLEILEQGGRFARRWRWLGDFELEYEWEREPDGSRMRGPGLSLELPIFQQGQDSLMRAEAMLERGRAEAAERALEVEHGIRRAHARAQALREVVAAYAEVVVPDRAEAVLRELERYNFMLVGAFDLLSAKREEFEAYAAWIEAVRDYWLARTELAHAAGRPLPAAEGAERTPALDSVIRPGAGHAGMDHSQHQGHGSMDHSRHQGHEGMDHSKHRGHEGMDHSKHRGHEGMDHSQHRGHEGRDHSQHRGHEGMDHSQHHQHRKPSKGDQP